MTAAIIDGHLHAQTLLAGVAAELGALPLAPGLAVVLVGDDPASHIYVRSKMKMAGRLGLRSEAAILRGEATEAEVMAAIAALNARDDIDGILVQLPLPAHLDAPRILAAVDPEKDVDGLHVVNIGRLWAGHAGLRPCTPAGIITMLDHYGVPIEGSRVVIINRSQLVGRPLAALMLERNATVTIAHSRTTDMAGITREADILVSAVGRVNFITPDMVKPSATVIDVSTNRITDPNGESRLTGDVRADVWDVAGAVSPSPGGVGPMTVAHLLYNTVLAAKRQLG